MLMRRAGLVAVVLGLLMCSCVPYLATRATDELMAEEYSPGRVRPATLEQVLSFLKEDRTDGRMFLPNTYDCKHFSADLWRSAYLKGFEAAMVLYLRERSQPGRNLAKVFYGIENPFHLVVAFLLTDGTWLYIEPQDDQILEIEEYEFRLEGAVAFDFWKRLRVYGEDGDEVLNEIVDGPQKDSREPCAVCGPAAISFPDQNLDAVIREAIAKASGDIYEADLESLTSLNASGRGVIAITGLEHARNLAHLYLDSNNISDVSPLAQLSSLTKLYLGWNEITDISALSELTRLTHLDLGANNISDVSALTGLTSLTWLRLDSNRIRDISPIAGLTSLNELYCAENQISDVSWLVANAGLGEGDRIDLNDNPLSEASLYTYIPELQNRGVMVFYQVPAR